MEHKAKKSLGQNFLKSEMALQKIIEAGEIKADDIILEIGPGKGALTEKLLENAGTVIAVEKDRELFKFLQEKFEKEIVAGKLILVEDDILEFDVKKTVLSFLNGLAGIETRRTEDLQKIPKLFSYKIIANIPYNITGAILKKFLTEKSQPERMILMVQHEVAKRIMGRGKNPSTPLRAKESILSISVKAYGEPKMIMKVPARYFSPSPKVDSAIICIRNISRKNFYSPLEEYSDLGSEGGGKVSTPSRKRPTPQEGKVDEEKFWEIVKLGFAHKRKKLSGNLKSLKNVKLGQLGDKRAEDLSLSDWINLVKML